MMPARDAAPTPSSRGRAAGRRPPELDAATLDRCRRGDPLAFRAFVVRYEGMVFALLSRMLGRGSHVEDLAQETFLRAFRAFGSFDVEATARPSTWLLTIATRIAIDERRRRVPDVAELEDEVEDASAPGPDRAVSQARLGEAIEAAAATLSAEQRAVFLLAELHDASMEEIARAVGIPEATVKTRLFRARQKLRAMLARYEEEAR